MTAVEHDPIPLDTDGYETFDYDPYDDTIDVARLAGLPMAEQARRAYGPSCDTDDDATTSTSSWQPVDLTDALAGQGIEPPALLTRDDGTCLLYRARTHTIHGEPGTLKSWLAQAAVAQALQAGGRVLYVDYEDNQHGIVERLRALHVDDATITERFVYVRPDEPLADRHGTPTVAAVHFTDLLEHGPYDLAVIDGVTESMTTEGLSPLENVDYARWNRRLARRLADTGAAVLAVDHVAKNSDVGRYAFGAQHKLAAISGAAYSAQIIRPLKRAGNEPVEALIKIVVTKDRPGHIGANSAIVAMMAVTAYPDGGVTIHLEGARGEHTEPDPVLRRAILDYLATYDGKSGRAITEEVEGRAEAVRDAVRWLVDQDLVRVELKGRSHLHWLTDKGRDALD